MRVVTLHKNVLELCHSTSFLVSGEYLSVKTKSKDRYGDGNTQLWHTNWLLPSSASLLGFGNKVSLWMATRSKPRGLFRAVSGK